MIYEKFNCSFKGWAVSKENGESRKTLINRSTIRGDYECGHNHGG